MCRDACLQSSSLTVVDYHTRVVVGGMRNGLDAAGRIDFCLGAFKSKFGPVGDFVSAKQIYKFHGATAQAKN